ncbi:unnamed protein product [Penicillium salamii]|uniref:Uncharacterized protein n=1 Tax=Penicillium salamii TaxID=1612424 RepID=A0A9W4JV71_9EURO|nr:unnamed protein product [Penicillium salamii]
MPPHFFQRPLRWLDSLTIKWEKVSTSPSKKRKSSETEDDALGEDESLQEPEKPPKPSKWAKLSSDSWLWETSAVIFSALCFTAIFCVVWVYDQKTSPQLPYRITLNSVISILGTASKSSVIFAVGESLGQLKWLWFWTAERRLRDLQSFDNASRGPWGSFNMLLQHKGRSIASLGALVTILALAFDPFLQQILTFPLREIPNPSNENPEASSFSQVHAIAPILPPDYFRGSPKELSPEQAKYHATFLDAVLSGLWSNQPQNNPTCASANFTWEPFRSVGYCTKCQDVTTLASLKGCDNVSFTYDVPFKTNTTYAQPSDCKISLPQGKSSPHLITFARKNITYDDRRVQQMNMTRHVVWEIHNIARIFDNMHDIYVPNSTFLGIENPLLVFGQAEIEYDFPDTSTIMPSLNQSPRVEECVLSLCSRTYNVSVTNGRPRVEFSSPDFGQSWFPGPETVVSDIDTEFDWRFTSDVNRPDAWKMCWKQWKGDPLIYQHLSSESILYNLPPPDRITGPHGSGFCYVTTLVPDIQQYIRGNLEYRTEIWDGGPYWSEPDGKARDADSDTFERVMRIGLNKMMANLAISLTNWALHESNDTNNGTSYISEVYVKVHWPWVALPAAVIILSSILLLSTALVSRSKSRVLWKTSTLPILYHGLDDDLLKDTDVCSALSKMETTAEATNVGLRLSDTKGKVLLQI